MGRTRRKGGSRKKRGGFLDEIKAAANNQAARFSNAAKEATDKAKKMAVKVHHETINNIDKGHQAFTAAAHTITYHAKNVADKAAETASAAVGKAETSVNTEVKTHMGGRRRTHKRKHRRKRKTRKRKHRRKRKTHRRHH
jgi:hypothetical protein